MISLTDTTSILGRETSMPVQIAIIAVPCLFVPQAVILGTISIIESSRAVITSLHGRVSIQIGPFTNLLSDKVINFANTGIHTRIIWFGTSLTP